MSCSPAEMVSSRKTFNQQTNHKKRLHRFHGPPGPQTFVPLPRPPGYPSPSRSAWITLPPAVHSYQLSNCITTVKLTKCISSKCEIDFLIISDISRLFRISLASQHPFLSFPTSASTVSAATCAWRRTPVVVGPAEGDGSVKDLEACKSW